MKKHTYILLGLLGLMLISCATGKNAFDKGNYETAIDRAVNRLQANPDNKKSKQVLSEGYKLASKYHLDLIGIYKSSADDFKWERIYQEYSQLNLYYSKIQRCPACLKLVKPTIYQTQLEDAGRQAAQSRFALGQAALADSTIDGGREAFRHFETAREYDNSLPGIDNLMDLAYDMGTLRVLIEKVPVHSRSLELTNEYFENRMHEYLDGYSRNKFVRFFTVDEAEQTGMQPDQVITLQFDDFVLGQTLIESNTKEVSRDSVVVGQYTDGEGVEHDVYGTVKAKVTTNRKTLESYGVMNMEIRDAYTGRILTNQKLPSRDVWVHEWASYNGDERALTKEEIRMARSKELPPPSPQTLFISFVDRIYAQVTQRVGDFYRNSEI